MKKEAARYSELCVVITSNVVQIRELRDEDPDFVFAKISNLNPVNRKWDRFI